MSSTFRLWFRAVLEQYFPGIDSDEEMSGADALERLNFLLEGLQEDVSDESDNKLARAGLFVIQAEFPDVTAGDQEEINGGDLVDRLLELYRQYI